MLRSASRLSVDEKAFVPCPVDRVAIRNWLLAAQRKTQDGLIEQNSFDTRMEANYDACFNLALVVVNAQGWKPKSSEGHHMYTLEAACHAIDASTAVFDRVDAIRELRNLKYGGVARSQRDVDVSARVLEEFSTLVLEWMKAHHPAMLT